jgi:hypothetical protein
MSNMLFETPEDTIHSKVSRLRRLKTFGNTAVTQTSINITDIVLLRSRLLQQNPVGTQNNCAQFLKLTVQFMYASFHYFSIIEYEAEVRRRPEQRGIYCFVFGGES